MASVYELNEQAHTLIESVEWQAYQIKRRLSYVGPMLIAYFCAMVAHTYFCRMPRLYPLAQHMAFIQGVIFTVALGLFVMFTVFKLAEDIGWIIDCWAARKRNRAQLATVTKQLDRAKSIEDLRAKGYKRPEVRPNALYTSSIRY